MSARRFRLLPDDPLENDIHEQCARVLDRARHHLGEPGTA